MSQTATRRFHRLGLATLVAVYFLILVGGVVRATGSGMGCPDWPTCFGSWVPPTDVGQLPPDYKEQYAAHRDKKNQKFASFLNALGMNETASRIVNDPSILQEADFNPTKTWVEYVNRLVGVLIGLFIVALFVVSLPLRGTQPKLFFGALALLVLVLIQGWFGSIVVSTNLTAWTVTIHMFLAIVMVLLLVWLIQRAGQGEGSIAPALKPWLLAGIIGFVIQTFLGTNVRAALDRLAAAAVDRAQWMAGAGIDFLIHRSFSWVLIAIQVVLYVKLRKSGADNASYLISILLILCSVLSGSAMAYFQVPALMQPIHLLVAVIAIGWMYQLYLRAGSSTGHVTAK